MVCIPSIYRQVRRETSRISTAHLSWSHIMLIPAYLSKSVTAFYTRCGSWTLKSLLRWLFWYFQHHFVGLSLDPVGFDYLEFNPTVLRLQSVVSWARTGIWHQDGSHVSFIALKFHARKLREVRLPKDGVFFFFF